MKSFLTNPWLWVFVLVSAAVGYIKYQSDPIADKENAAVVANVQQSVSRVYPTKHFIIIVWGK